MKVSPEQATKGLVVDGQPFTLTVDDPHILNEQVAKFTATEVVAAAV